jgi:serine-type D-Ala-D-Ala carboxypeptidase/endopeptidase (penicillin-binding protein 4)
MSRISARIDRYPALATVFAASMPRPRHLILLAACALSVALPATAHASLRSRLAAPMRQAGASSGAYVFNATKNRAVLRYAYDRPRILASNTKLFTTTTALARFGVAGRLSTEVRGDGTLGEDGKYDGNLYVVGGGDPTFGSRSFVRRNYGSGGTVEALADELEKAGVASVTGRIVGDESKFDSLRGGPDSHFGISPYVGPLSAMSFNRGLATESGRGYQRSPAAFSAAKLDAALARRHIAVRGKPKAGRVPRDVQRLAAVNSPTMARLVQLTNKPSDNFFAEMLLKALPLTSHAKGTTKTGTRLAARFTRRIGGRPSRLVDGSGLSRANRASPYRVAKLLLAMRKRDEYRAFYNSLSIAGRDGTLGPRMRSGPARRRCRGKTGTISGVSAVSGYCTSRSGDVYVFSILMNGVNAFNARPLQDRMLQAIAGS